MTNNNRYPQLEIDLEAVRYNTALTKKLCGDMGIEITAVIKGASGLPKVTLAMDSVGPAQIGSSRLDELRDAKNAGVKAPLMLIRVPMVSEASETVELAEYSLNSEFEALKALNAAAISQGKVHKVILMVELGDLREGIYDRDELLRLAKFVEDSEGLYLSGTGTNVGCYGSVQASYEKLSELVEANKKVEEYLGRKMDIVSGGASTSMARIFNKNMPKGINHLRPGLVILTPDDLRRFYGDDPEGAGYNIHVLKVKAQIAEAKLKPTYPQGTLTLDAFGQAPSYVDRGIRKKAIIDLGRVDFGEISGLIPLDPKIEVMGASSDHTIIDINDCEPGYDVGDIVEFELTYPSMAYMTHSRDVKII